MSETKKPLYLPSKNYEPFFMKVMHDFIEYHKLPKDLPLPEMGIGMNLCMSRILDVMVHSMGEEKRKEILEDLDKYRIGIPAAFKY